MWRWITFLVILVLVGRPIILINNPACDKPEDVTAVTDAPPCHDTLEPTEASPAPNHTCPCPAMIMPIRWIGTAVSTLASLWSVDLVIPQTAVHVPPSPPPRLI